MNRLKNGKISRVLYSSFVFSTISTTPKASADDDLPSHLVAGPQAVMGLADDLQIVVGESDGAEGRRSSARRPHERVGQIRPEQCRDQRRRQDQQPAHRRRARLLAVRRRPFLPDDLTDLELAELPDEERAEESPIASAVRLAAAVRNVM